MAIKSIYSFISNSTTAGTFVTKCRRSYRPQALRRHSHPWWWKTALQFGLICYGAQSIGKGFWEVVQDAFATDLLVILSEIVDSAFSFHIFVSLCCFVLFCFCLLVFGVAVAALGAVVIAVVVAIAVMLRFFFIGSHAPFSHIQDPTWYRASCSWRYDCTTGVVVR